MQTLRRGEMSTRHNKVNRTVLNSFALNILTTMAACLLTYQVLVRYTFGNVLLNGRREAKVVPSQPAQAEPK